jgi:succinate dehydrogenase / fumarate reductase cytochrome b subunit
MKLLSFLFTSSIGRKLIMALTGLFLCLFLVVHLIGNLQLFKADGGYAFNHYAWFMTSNPLIKTVSWGLYAMIILHAVKGIYLAMNNRKARQSRYEVSAGSAGSSWSSRNMAILGSIIFIFIGIHMGDFWREYKFGDEITWRSYTQDYNTQEVTWTEYTPVEGQKIYAKDIEGGHMLVAKDLYSEVYEAFRQPWIVWIYVLSMLALAFHLLHGFQSAFQTLGVNHPSYSPIIQFIGRAFAILVPLGFAAIPLYVLFQ